MSGRLIPAFTLIHRDDLANPETHLWNEQWIPKGALPANVVIDRAKVMGRVLNHDKAPGYVFTEDDFMPVGTRSGIVAAIPPGKRSLTLESAKITGIHRLRMGDRFDIVGTLPVPKNQPAPQGRGASAVPRPKPEVLVLVRDGTVIQFRASAAPGHDEPIFGIGPAHDHQAGGGSDDCLGSGRNSGTDRGHGDGRHDHGRSPQRSSRRRQCPQRHAQLGADTAADRDRNSHRGET